jgi:2-phosphoglycerate kinase
MHYPKVVLIGGAPMSGKTTVSRLMAKRLGHGCFSTDDLGEAIRAVTTSQSHPALHPMEGSDYREYYVSRSIEDLIKDAEREHQALWPAVEVVIRAHATWRSPLLLEGWALRPARVSRLDLLGTVSLWLIVDERLLEERIRADVAFYRGASDEDVMKRKCLARSVWYNTHVREAVSQWGLTAVQVPRRASPDEICEICVGLLANAAAT